MTTVHALHFADTALLSALQQSTDAEWDAVDFGIIGIDAANLVCRHNACESQLAGLSPQRVLGDPLFTVVMRYVPVQRPG
ncbi:MAG: hypothetical protein QE285_21095 [Aquabacterium sp.]|nr:hypothetical protein [Aquabacterium sp.]